MALMPDTEDGSEPKELAEKHDGASASRENIQATMEYTVKLATDTIECMPDHLDAKEFAERIAASRMEKELDPTFSISSNDAMASEDEGHILNGEKRYTVFVRVSQND